MRKFFAQLNEKSSRRTQYDLSERSFHGFTWSPFPFVRYTLYLLLGISWGVLHPIEDVSAWQATLYALAGIYFFIWIISRTLLRGIRFPVVFGTLGAAVLVLCGFLLLHQQHPKTNPSHLLHQSAGMTFYQGTLVSEVQERATFYKAELEIESIQAGSNWQTAHGKVLLYLEKSGQIPRYGDKLLVKGVPPRVAAPANPGEFDYRGYLEIQQIHHQHFLKKNDFVIYGHSVPNPVLAASLRVREWAKGVFRRHVTAPQEYTIAVGLVLGIREGMDEEMKAAYASAGAMHVLAVSGAHVVIVFWIVALLLGFLKKFRHGRWLFAGSALGLLWFYAFITGLSSSVLRAVVMFSFVIVADATGREKSNYNFLAASAFLLLCLNPWFLLDVGFQLSYAAVLGIIYLHPKIYGWFDFRTVLADKLWGMTSTCLAAQIGVLPFTIFYFHQFPVYFMLANLVVIPLSSAILYAGIGLLFISWIPVVSGWIALAFQGLIWLLNQCAFFTLTLPGAIVGGFFLTKLEFGLLTGLLLFTLVFLEAKRLWQMGLVTALLGAMILVDLQEEKTQVKQQKLAIYSVKGHSAIGFIEGHTHLLLADSALLGKPDKIKFHLQNDWNAAGVTQSTFAPFGISPNPIIPARHYENYSVFVWQGKRFVVLHKPLPKYPQPVPKADVLVIRQNALRHLSTWKGSFGQLVVDASNRYALGKRLWQQAHEMNLPCHWMAQDGAYLLEGK